MSFIAQALFLFGFPLIISAGTAYLSWGALTRPWAYLLVSSLLLYLAYAIVFYFLAPKSVGYMISGTNPGQFSSSSKPLLMLLAPYVKPLLVFPPVALLLVALLLRFFKR